MIGEKSSGRGLRSVHLLVSSLLLCVTVTRAAVFNVDDTRDLVDANTADGNCATAEGTCTLRAAIQQANALTGTSDTINLPAGIYALTRAGLAENGAATGDLDVTDPVDIVGPDRESTTIDAKGLDRVFHILGVTNASIQGVTIRGGAMGDPTFPDYLGGGVLVENGSSLDLSDCAVISNDANAGGGIYTLPSSQLTASDCSFRNNSALDLGFTNAEGSAILDQGTLDLDRVEISANHGSVATGAVVSSNATSASIRNTTISNNQDAGLRTQNTELDLENSTIYGNAADGLQFFSAGGAHDLTVRNSILAHNGGFDCAAFTPPTNMDFAGEHNLDSDGSCPLDDVAPTVDLAATDPQLGPLDLHGGLTRTHVPRFGSPVVDAGNNARCESLDQRRAPRPLDAAGGGAVCDIGAVEHQRTHGEPPLRTIGPWGS